VTRTRTATSSRADSLSALVRPAPSIVPRQRAVPDRDVDATPARVSLVSRRSPRGCCSSRSGSFSCAASRSSPRGRTLAGRCSANDAASGAPRPRRRARC
jgi:hypothetical protein